MLENNMAVKRFDTLSTDDMENYQGGMAPFFVIAGVGAAMYGAGYAIGKAAYHMTH